MGGCRRGLPTTVKLIGLRGPKRCDAMGERRAGDAMQHDAPTIDRRCDAMRCLTYSAGPPMDGGGCSPTMRCDAMSSVPMDPDDQQGNGDARAMLAAGDSMSTYFWGLHSLARPMGPSGYFR